jgi:hypothetical protein
MAKRKVRNQINNLIFDQQKVGNRPTILLCRWRVTYHCKALNKGYIFALDLIPIGALYTKLWGPKIVGIPILAIWESQDKKPFGCGLRGDAQSIM